MSLLRACGWKPVRFSSVLIVIFGFSSLYAVTYDLYICNPAFKNTVAAAFLIVSVSLKVYACYFFNIILVGFWRRPLYVFNGQIK